MKHWRNALSVWPAGALFVLVGCAELRMEPDQIPTAMLLAPHDTLVTVGDVVQIRVTVLDQDGNEMKGPPSWAQPVWSVSDPAALSIERNGRATVLRGGLVEVRANLAGIDVDEGETEITLRLNPKEVVLSASAIYLTQGAQNVDGTLPLVANRRALLRVFVTGDQTSFFRPKARATFYQDGVEVYSVPMDRDKSSEIIPTKVEEHRLDRDFNAVIPGEVLQPGVEMVVELDTEDVVPKATGSQARFPATGAMALDVREVPLMHQIMVPVLMESNPDRRVLNWTRGMDADSRHLRLARSTMPIADMKVTVQDEYITSNDLTDFNGWQNLLREMKLKWDREFYGNGYVYGAVVLPPGSPIGGLGYINKWQASVGRPTPGTYAHELGHNMTLLHAPCGGAGGPDPQYPYDGGEIGVWGYDFHRPGVPLDPRQYKDLMGYCSSDWVSDYHFHKSMDFRIDEEDCNEFNIKWPSCADGSAPPAKESTLLLWGGAGEVEMVLEPAFLQESRPVLPQGGGPYRLEGFRFGGGQVFSFSFTPVPVEFGGGHFSFAIPYHPDRDGLLERVVLSGPEGEVTMRANGAPPMAIVTRRSDGQIRAIIRDWTGTSALLGADTDVVVSTGLPGGAR